MQLQRWAHCRLCWGTEKLGPTSDSMMEMELIHLRHSHDILRGVAKDLGVDATGLLRTHLMMTRFFVPILGDYARPCLIAWAMFDLLVFFSTYFFSTHELCS